MEEKIIAEIEKENEIEGIIDLEPLKGAQGYSAYEIYLKNLSDGETPTSEQEWLDNLSKANYYKCFSKRIFHQKNDEPLEFIPIDVTSYNSTCLLEVFVNGFKLNGAGVDSDYLIITNEEFNDVFLKNHLDTTKTYIQLKLPLNSNGVENTVDLYIYKTVVATNNDYDLLKGEKGLNGKDGLGVPAGGTAGQVLAKKSDTDNDTEWVEQTGKGGAGIAIGGEEPTDTDVKIWFPNDTVGTEASEVVNSMDGDETDASPSVHAVKEYVNKYIVKSGSNSNGNYIKFSDGTMICHKHIAGTGGSVNAWGSLYFRDVQAGNWAMDFKTILNVQCTNATNQYWASVSNASETSCGTVRLIRPDSNAVEYHIHLFAIGTWEVSE